jgi:hypothetical protein
MRFAAIVLVTSIGAASLAAPGTAEARFGTGAVADALADLRITQLAQHRTQQRPRRARPANVAPPQASGTVSPYRYPGSRGALDSCAFC